MLQSITPYQHSADGFIGSLVQANLQPLMQELADIDSFLESLQPAISRIAYGQLASGLHRGVEQDDLVQEGLLAVWQCTQRFDAEKTTNEGVFKRYCLTRARGAMVDYLRKHYRTGGDSTTLEPEQWLTVPAASPAPTPATFTRKRKTVLVMLQTLSRRERLAVMAQYGITGTHNRVCTTRQVLQARHHLTNAGFTNARNRALKKLSSLPCPC